MSSTNMNIVRRSEYLHFSISSDDDDDDNDDVSSVNNDPTTTIGGIFQPKNTVLE
mgnify:CR=1 FL=1